MQQQFAATYMGMLHNVINLRLYCSTCVSLIFILDCIVPVRFNPATYSVIGNRTSVTVTLEALAEHDHSFTVIVATRDGSAVGEWELLMGIQCPVHMYVYM